ncbi:MAG: hypothetical protein IPP66_13045 [Anaerolineales bacterium]|nr:hypothetical protein [Anaerolineales bacterium]
MSFRPKISRPILYFILILALASQACALSLLDLPINTGNPTQSVPAGPAPTPLPRAEVKFTVQLPEPLAQNEILAISVLDEVTGLALNGNDYQMTQVDAITYSATFPIPDQSVIKYRYVRRGGSRVVEDTNTDGTIRYRLIYVNGPTDIVDTVNSWTDKPVNTISGSMFGTVVNADTGAPLPEIMVTAGGVQTLTDSAGRFTLEGLRGGRHNLVAFALDGMYRTFQQGAIVEGNKGTAVEVKMKPAQLVNVIFTVAVPQNTQRDVPVRIAGSLLQFGNTFTDLRGGLSTAVDRMPIMTSLPDGRYSVSLFLPAGAYLEYKYTLGDGFWNSEFNTAGKYVVRNFVVPSQNTAIEDTVQSWQAGPNSPITFEVDVPPTTPIGDVIYIQFNPAAWTEPIPMWKVSNYRWSYKLFGPLNILGSFTYRYCRNAQCNSADDVSTAGENAHGKNITPTITAQDVQDTVSQWTWSQDLNATLVQVNIPSRGTGFVAGVEFQAFYEPGITRFNQDALQNIHAFNGNWVFLDPTWTFKSSAPVIFTQQPGKDPFSKDTTETASASRALNMNVAIFPQARFATNANDFWKNAPRDSGWWDSWFNHYRAFAVNFADTATKSDAQALILGGDWIAPALPNGKLADGSPSGVPADAEARWLAIVAEARQHYAGLILFALPYTNTDIQPPINLLKSTDGLYLLWFAKISDQASPNKAAMTDEIGKILDNNVFPVQTQINKPIIIGLTYPSSTYSATGCIPNGTGGCFDWTILNRPNPDLGTVNLDLQQQFDIYDAMLNAINGRTWVSGLVSRGYFPPVELQDKSASVHGKPAADLLWYWFPRLLGNVK